MRRFLRKPITEARLRRLGFGQAKNGCSRYPLPGERLGLDIRCRSFLQLLERSEGGGGWWVEVHSELRDLSGELSRSSVCLPREFHLVYEVCLLLEVTAGPFSRQSPGRRFPRRWSAAEETES
ncbi:MAG: hypothetical protein KF777_15690 [Planctomycetaceae bacterium]|nr:hypothetical protein [Planctomycetaceae bacterium]